MRLGVNIDHIATVRQARKTLYPSIAEAVAAAEEGGADFITAHLREDRRHISDEDLPIIMSSLRTHLNLEIAAEEEMRAIALTLKPRAVCLVPEKRAELTTEGGLNVSERVIRLRDFCAPLCDAGVEVSLFIDPEEEQIVAAAETGAPVVELHTGAYAETGDIKPLALAVRLAADAGLKVNAGHGLTLDNVAPVAALPEIAELNIGHAIIARALFIGLQQAVREMADIIAAAEKK